MAPISLLLVLMLCNCWGAVLVPWILLAGISISYLLLDTSPLNITLIILALSAPICVLIGLSCYFETLFPEMCRERLKYLSVSSCLFILAGGSRLENILARVIRSIESTNTLTKLTLVTGSQIFNAILLMAFVLILLLLILELPFSWLRANLKQRVILPKSALRLLIILGLLSLGGGMILEYIERSLIL